MLHFEGLRKKIIKNYFIIIIITVALFECLFIGSVTNYYYDSVAQNLKSQAGIYNTTINVESTTFEQRVIDIINREKSERPDSKVAIQIIDKDRNIVIDQYGFKTEQKAEFEDVERALRGAEELIPYTYRLGATNEHVMSISAPIKIDNVIEGAIRYTVSLEMIDDTIFRLSIILLFAGIGILMIGVMISLRFADTLIQPLNELKKFANELADGNYNIKLKNTKISDDEIGDLAETFVHMAEEIEKSEILKKEFISSVSHELRTPLTSIKGWSETLGYEGITREELDLGLDIIQDETERMIKLVEELLDLSKMTSDTIKLNIDTVNVENLARGVVNQLKVKAVENNIDLRAEFEKESIAPIHGDKDRLRQVLINLIQNSLKFTEDGGYIVVKVDQDDEFTTINVLDNGEGIEQENLEKVMDKFFQENYNKSGSGLGLSISSVIVKLHGGSMTVQSEKGVGTSITVKIKNKLIESV